MRLELANHRRFWDNGDSFGSKRSTIFLLGLLEREKIWGRRGRLPSGVRQKLLSISLAHYPATIMQENATVFCDLLNTEGNYMYVYTRP